MAVNGLETKMTIHEGKRGHRDTLILGTTAEGMPPGAERYVSSTLEAPVRTETPLSPAEKRGVRRIWSFLKALIPSMDPASRALR